MHPPRNQVPVPSFSLLHLILHLLEISDIIHTGEYQTAQRNTYRSSDTFPFLLFKKPGKAFNLGKINGWSSDYHHPFIPSVTRAACVCARQLAQSTSNLGPSVKQRWGPSLRETNDLSHVIDHLPMGHLSFLCLARCNPLSFAPPVSSGMMTADSRGMSTNCGKVNLYRNFEV